MTEFDAKRIRWLIPRFVCLTQKKCRIYSPHHKQAQAENVRLQWQQACERGQISKNVMSVSHREIAQPSRCSVALIGLTQKIERQIVQCTKSTTLFVCCAIFWKWHHILTSYSHRLFTVVGHASACLVYCLWDACVFTDKWHFCVTDLSSGPLKTESSSGQWQYPSEW